MGVDGGMNPTFLSAVKSNGGPGATIRTASGTIPAHVNPPAEPEPTGSVSLASAESRPAQVQVASAADSGGIKGFFANLFGSKRNEQTAESSAKPSATSAQSPPPASNRSAKTETQPTDSKRAKVAAAKPESTPPRQQANTESETKPASTTNTLAGAAPAAPAGVFDRFGSWR
jgi:hypothetical protein